MLPLSHRDSSSLGIRVKEKLLGLRRLLFSEKSTRNLFLFLLLNLSFAFVEFSYGIWTNSWGLISDSFHMFFDCTGLLCGVIASVITKWRANERFSYGYVRAEVLSGFINGLFLIFIASFVMLKEAIERVVEPPEVKHERLFLVSFLGLLVNLVGIYAFQHEHGHAHGGGGGGGHGHSHGGHSHGGGRHTHNHGHSHNHHHHDVEVEPVAYSAANSQIMKGVFLHILADTLGSVGVIISAVLIKMFGWMIADPISSILIAVLIIYSTLPLLKESFVILMQRQPSALDRVLPQCYNKVTQLVGVYSVQDQHFWTLCSDVYVGCLKLEVARTADPKYVVTHTQMIFQEVGVRQLTVQLDYAPM